MKGTGTLVLREAFKINLFFSLSVSWSFWKRRVLIHMSMMIKLKSLHAAQEKGMKFLESDWAIINLSDANTWKRSKNPDIKSASAMTGTVRSFLVLYWKKERIIVKKLSEITIHSINEWVKPPAKALNILSTISCGLIAFIAAVLKGTGEFPKFTPKSPRIIGRIEIANAI